MSQTPNKPARIGLPVIVALVLLIVVVFIFVIAVINQTGDGTFEGTGTTVAADSYRAQVDALLAIAHPENAEAALGKYGCIACHRAGNAELAPSWVGLSERAATERPPLPADAYIYESIVDPAAYLVEGYNDVMPHDFATRMSQQELADVLAYLLTPEAQ